MPCAKKFTIGAIGFAMVLAIVGAIWLALPYLLEIALLTLAARSGFHSVTIDIDAVNWKRTTVRRFAANTDTEFGPVSLDLRGLTVRYRASDLRLDSMQAESGLIRWDFKPTETPVSERDVPRISLPVIPPIEVDRVDIAFESAWGLSRFTGDLEIAEETGAYAMRLSDERQSVELRFDRRLDTAEVDIQFEERPVLALSVRNASPTRLDINGSAQLHHLRNWSQGTAMVPDALSTALQDRLTLDNGSFDVTGHAEWGDVLRFQGEGTGAWQNLKQEAMTSSARLRYRCELRGDILEIAVLPRSDIVLGDVRWGDDASSVAVPTAKISVEANLRVRADDRGWALEQGTFQGRTAALEVALDGQQSVHAQSLDVSGTVKPSGAFHSVELSLSAAVPSSPSLSLTADKLQASAAFETDRRLRARGTFTATGVRWTDLPQFPRSVSIAGSFKGRDRVFTAQGSAQIEKLRVGTWNFATQQPSGARLTTAFDLDAQTAEKITKPILGKEWRDLTLSAGAVSGNAELTWNGAASGKATASASGVAGRYQKSEFKDVGVEFTSDDVFGGRFRIRIAAGHGQIATGIPFADLSIEVESRGDAVDLRVAKLRALGGSFELFPTTIDKTRTDHRIVIRVADLDFSRLLQTIDRPELSGSGRLDGNIPLEFTATGPRISNAEFQSTSVGTLRYATGTATATQSDNIALQALDNFHYSAMRVRVDYEPEGGYQVRVRLEGRNPELYDGYPIAFNLNLTGELPGLLRAGLFSGDFGEQILKNVQSERLSR